MATPGTWHADFPGNAGDVVSQLSEEVPRAYHKMDTAPTTSSQLIQVPRGRTAAMYLNAKHDDESANGVAVNVRRVVRHSTDASDRSKLSIILGSLFGAANATTNKIEGLTPGFYFIEVAINPTAAYSTVSIELS